MAERGQASVELVAGVALLVLAGLACLQLLVAGYSLSLVDGAAEAGALALAAGREPKAAVDEALPGWARDGAEVEVDGGRVALRLRPPAALPAIAQALEVSSSAWVRRPEGGG
ncbi:MAG: hypothetical protein ACRDK9_03585 [Solirubrobacterales bacterium]